MTQSPALHPAVPQSRSMKPTSDDMDVDSTHQTQQHQTQNPHHMLQQNPADLAYSHHLLQQQNINIRPLIPAPRKNPQTVVDTLFNVDERYECLEPCGSGAYGTVCGARDLTNGNLYAIKKIEHAFDHLTFTKRTLRELKILRQLRHENIIGLREILLPEDKDTFTDIYVVSELMETDLASIIKSPQPLSEEHVQFFLYQLLRGLKYTHSAGIIHRDLKPRNLLVNSNCDLKICDFGLARIDFQQDNFKHAAPMTEYVSTRWYRAPEVLCSWHDYSAAIDVWSVGCIVAELLSRRPLFPGINTQNQLHLIINFLGKPTPEELAAIPNEKCQRFVLGLPTARVRPLEHHFPGASREALDLLRRMLLFDPFKRITIDEALNHPYLSGLHSPTDEVPVRDPVDAREFEFERRHCSMSHLREEIYREMLQYHDEARFVYNAHYARDAPTVHACPLVEPGELTVDELLS
eukprot:GDKI01018804.1.p1 GENE.GDKI01018804.1~~GDKI01018804.1.p1  ORF type:complete len:464 (-),score=87.14 GDKI01018804.1:99-1490(-)